SPEAHLRLRDAGGVGWRALRRAQKDHATNLAQAVAFNLFLAIPSAALIVVGVFATVASEGTAGRLLQHLSGVVPASVVVGAVLAVWSLSGAMQTLQWALNIAHDLEEKRGIVHRRLAGLAMLACCLLAFILAFGLLVLGPQATHWVGDAINQPTVVSWI